MPRRNSADHNMDDKPPGRREQSKDKSRVETKRTQKQEQGETQTTSISDASMSRSNRATDDEGELEATSEDPGGVPPQAVSTETVRPSWVNYQTTLRERKHY